MTDSIEFHSSDEWTAVYLNGQLQRVGDHYLADEWLRSRVGVVEVDDDAFMRGGDQRSGVAQTLDLVRDYQENRDRLRADAASLREQAAALEAQAASLLTQSKADS